MTKGHVRLFSVGLLLFSVLSVVGFARFTNAAQESVKADEAQRDPALRELIHYRQWARANEKPLPIFDPSSFAI